MKMFLTSVIFVSLAMLSSAQDAPEKMIAQFFQEYGQGQPEKALDRLYSHMPWADRIKDNLDKMKTQFAGLQTLVGKYYGYKLLAGKTLAGTFSIYSYIVKFDRQPVRFLFKFYKPQDKWLLYGFSYDDSLGDELEDAVRVSAVETVE